MAALPLDFRLLSINKTITMKNPSTPKLTPLIFFFMILFSLFMSCSDDDDMAPMEEEMEEMNACDGTDPSFASDVLPILNRSCALSGCHVEGFASGDFSNFDGFASRASSAVSRMSAGSMPPASSSGPDPTDAQIQLIRCWIEAGSKNN